LATIISFIIFWKRYVLVDKSNIVSSSDREDLGRTLKYWSKKIILFMSSIDQNSTQSNSVGLDNKCHSVMVQKLLSLWLHVIFAIRQGYAIILQIPSLKTIFVYVLFQIERIAPYAKESVTMTQH
jgi:hypothetical protein